MGWDTCSLHWTLVALHRIDLGSGFELTAGIEGGSGVTVVADQRCSSTHLDALGCRAVVLFTSVVADCWCFNESAPGEEDICFMAPNSTSMNGWRSSHYPSVSKVGSCRCFFFFFGRQMGFESKQDDRFIGSEQRKEYLGNGGRN